MRRVLVVALVLVSCVVLMSGCHTSSLTACRASMATYKNGAVDGRQLVKSAEISLETYELNKSVTEVKEVATKYNATIEQANIREGKSAFIKLLVPSNKLNAAIESLKKCGSEIECNVYSLDVTNKVNDLNAVIKNKKALRDRLRKLLDKAQSIDDILKLEKELSRLQAEIDRMDKQLAHYETSVKYSAVSISIKQKKILGPVGYAFEGVFWLISKLFVIN